MHGFSQGAQLASLAGNYSHQVSAALMFGNGNYNPMLRGDFTCLNDNNLVLTRERRRSITGSNDGVFGDGTLAGTMKQQKETSGYDCGDRLNCFSHVPNEVLDTYLGGDAMIESKLSGIGYIHHSGELTQKTNLTSFFHLLSSLMNLQTLVGIISSRVKIMMQY